MAGGGITPFCVADDRGPMRVVPARISLALDWCGLYGPEVDAACDAVEPEVDLWELGQAAPSPEQVAKLAGLTGFPVAFFYKPVPPGPLAGSSVFVCYSGRRGCDSLAPDVVDAYGVLLYGGQPRELPRAVQASLFTTGPGLRAAEARPRRRSPRPPFPGPDPGQASLPLGKDDEMTGTELPGWQVLGWDDGGEITAIVLHYAADPPARPDPGFSVMPRAAVGPGRWPPFAGATSFGPWFGGYREAGHLVSLHALISGTSETVYWVPVTRIPGAGAGLIAVRHPLRPAAGSWTLPAGVYVFHRARQGGASMPSLDAALRHPDAADLGQQLASHGRRKARLRHAGP